MTCATCAEVFLQKNRCLRVYFFLHCISDHEDRNGGQVRHRPTDGDPAKRGVKFVEWEPRMRELAQKPPLEARSHRGTPPPARLDQNSRRFDMNGLAAVTQHLLDKYPISVPFRTTASMLGYKSVKAAYTAKCRGTFPLNVTRAGAGLSVMTADVIDYVTTQRRPDTPKEVQREIKPHVGRPTKSESIEAKNRGLTVPELRAQASITLGGRDHLIMRCAIHEASHIVMMRELGGAGFGFITRVDDIWIGNAVMTRKPRRRRTRSSILIALAGEIGAITVYDQEDYDARTLTRELIKLVESGKMSAVDIVMSRALEDGLTVHEVQYVLDVLARRKTEVREGAGKIVKHAQTLDNLSILLSARGE